jgi:hypothetical protein
MLRTLGRSVAFMRQTQYDEAEFLATINGEVFSFPGSLDLTNARERRGPVEGRSRVVVVRSSTR